MKKLLSIVLAIALVFGTLPAFADHAAIESATAGENLFTYGYISGVNAAGDLNEEGLLTRAELAVIVASIRNESAAAAAFAGEAGFPDVKADDWFAPYVAYAKANGLMSGTSEGTFAPHAKVSSKQAAVVILAALGYQADVDFAWNTVEADLLNLTGIAIVSADEILRGDLFAALWEAVSKPVMKAAEGEEKQILGVVTGKIPAADLVPPVTELLIESVGSANLKEVFVTFNQKVDEDNLGTYEIAKVKGNKDQKISTKVLQEDGMTVKLVMDKALADSTAYKLTVKDTVSAKDAEMKLAEKEVEFSIQDVERPRVESVKVSGPKQLTITFTEPIEKVGKVKVKHGKTTLGHKNPTADLRTVNVELYSNMKDGEEYTIEISEFKDYNKMENIPASDTFTYAEDKEAPTLSVKEATQEYVVVEFSKPVKGLEPKFFHHTFTKYKAVKIVKVDKDTEIKKNDAVSSAKIVFYTDGSADQWALPAGTVKFMWDGDKIKDLWDNKLGDGETELSISADLEKPEVKKVEVKSNTKLVVEFTKAVDRVDSGVSYKKCFVVKDEKGKLITTTVTPDADKKKWTVMFKKQDDGKTIELVLDKLEDKTLNANKLDKYTETLTIADADGPKVEMVKYLSDATLGYAVNYTGDDIKPAKIFVFFDETVEKGALDGANYKLGNGTDYISLENEGEFYEDSSKVVVFELTKAEWEKVGSIADPASYNKMIVVKVEDKEGNAVQSEVKDLENMATLNPAGALDYAKDADHGDKPYIHLTAKNKMVVRFNQDITDLDGAVFTVHTTTGGVTTAVVANGESTTDKANEVELTFANNLVADNEKVGDGLLDIELESVAGVKTQFGGDVAQGITGAQNVLDVMAPEVAKNANDDDMIKAVKETATEKGYITITFTRPLEIQGSSLSNENKAKIEKALKLSNVNGDKYSYLATGDMHLDYAVAGNVLTITFDKLVADDEVSLDCTASDFFRGYNEEKVSSFSKDVLVK